MRAKMTSSAVLQPALSVVLEGLEKIRDSREKPLRVSRATLNRLFEQASPADGVDADVSSARKTDVAAKAAPLAQVRERVCVWAENVRRSAASRAGRVEWQRWAVLGARGARAEKRSEGKCDQMMLHGSMSEPRATVLALPTPRPLRLPALGRVHEMPARLEELLQRVVVH